MELHAISLNPDSYLLCPVGRIENSTPVPTLLIYMPCAVPSPWVLQDLHNGVNEWN